jgi:hypothetical protein
MASVMEIRGEVIGECIEGIRVEVRKKYWGWLWCALDFFGWALSASLGLLSGCVDGNGVRY